MTNFTIPTKLPPPHDTRHHLQSPTQSINVVLLCKCSRCRQRPGIHCLFHMHVQFCAEHTQTIRMHPHHQMAKVCSTADTRNDAPDGARNISVLCIVSTPVPSPAKHTCARFCPAMAMAMHDDTPFFAILVCMWSGIVHRCASCTHGIRMYPHFMLPPKSRKSDSENANLEKCVCTLRNRLLFAKSSALRNQRFGTVTVPAFAADHITSRTLCSFSFRCTKAV